MEMSDEGIEEQVGEQHRQWLDEARQGVDSLGPEQRAQAEVSIMLLTRMGAREPITWVYSQMKENIPQVARFMVLRLIRRNAMDVFAPNPSLSEAQIEPTLDLERVDAEAQEALARLLASGCDPQDILRLTRAATYNAVVGVVEVIDAQVDWDNEDGPGWALMELDSEGRPTGRRIGALHEDLLDVFPSDQGLS